MTVLIARLVKLVTMVVIHTPLLHRLVSTFWASIEFTGRKTGKIYRTPIAYHQEGDRVYITVVSRWWLNLKGGAQVRLLLRLRAHIGNSYPIDDREEAVRRLRQILDEVPKLAYPGDVRIVNGEVSDQELDRVVAAGRRVIEIRLRES